MLLLLLSIQLVSKLQLYKLDDINISAVSQREARTSIHARPPVTALIRRDNADSLARQRRLAATVMFSPTTTKNYSERHTHTHTHNRSLNGPLSGTTRAGRYQMKHSPTHTHPDHQTPLSSSSIYDPRHPLCSVYELDSPLGQPLSRSSLVFLLALDPQLHTPCISSPSHYLLFKLSNDIEQ